MIMRKPDDTIFRVRFYTLFGAPFFLSRHNFIPHNQPRVMRMGQAWLALPWWPLRVPRHCHSPSTHSLFVSLLGLFIIKPLFYHFVSADFENMLN